MPAEDEDEDDYFLPLQDQRVFGAGIKRKRVPFIRAESDPSPSPTPASTVPKAGLADRYLAIVLPPRADTRELPVVSIDTPRAEKTSPTKPATICPVCRLPTSTSTSPTKPHETSLAHQVCLPHSHPPSHLDRSRLGLKYLSSYGWDPDARRGLGPTGTGIRVPVKGKVKNDTVGLGVRNGEHVRVQKETKETKGRSRNARQVREQEAMEKERDRRLREAFYGRDLEPYLGPGG